MIGESVTDPLSVVRRFYAEIWNAGELSAIPEIRAAELTFHGSPGVTERGHAGFAEYVQQVRAALGDYSPISSSCTTIRATATDSCRSRHSPNHIDNPAKRPSPASPYGDGRRSARPCARRCANHSRSSAASSRRPSLMSFALAPTKGRPLSM